MKDYYTTGEPAKFTGVSYKTIRGITERAVAAGETADSDYRLYGQESIEKLQRILMLKYLDFLLGEIAQVLGQEDSVECFDRQVELLYVKKEHLESIQRILLKKVILLFT